MIPVGKPRAFRTCAACKGSLSYRDEDLANCKGLCTPRHRRSAPHCREGSLHHTAQRIPSTLCRGASSRGSRGTHRLWDKDSVGNQVRKLPRTWRRLRHHECNAALAGTRWPCMWAGTGALAPCPRRKSPQGTPSHLSSGMAGRTIPPLRHREARARRRLPGFPAVRCSARLLSSRPWGCRA